MAHNFTYSDLDIQFRRQTDGDIQKDIDVDAIINSLSNIMATIQGSRRMLPEFAQGLHQLLFEPMTEDSAKAIGQLMLEGVRTWEDRVEVTGIDITPRFDNNEYRILMNVKIKALDEEQSIEFILFAQ